RLVARLVPEPEAYGVRPSLERVVDQFRERPGRVLVAEVAHPSKKGVREHHAEARPLFLLLLNILFLARDVVDGHFLLFAHSDSFSAPRFWGSSVNSTVVVEHDVGEFACGVVLPLAQALASTSRQRSESKAGVTRVDNALDQRRLLRATHSLNSFSCR